VRRRPPERRILTTVLFTDIVGSTERATELGDRGWRDLLRAHHAAVRRALKQHGGREVDTAGDGFFATFGAPTDAIRCAIAAREAVRPLGIVIRAGLHFGETEPGEKVGGIAVIIGARVLGEAQPGEILITATLRELVAGSEFRFSERGVRTLKGVSGEWPLFAVEPREATAVVVPPVAGRSSRVPPLRVVAIALGAIAVGAVIALGAIALQRPPPVTGPNSVVRIDLGSNQLTHGVRVGDGPAGLVATDGVLWVANAGSQTVSRVDASTATQLYARGGFGVPGAIASSEDAVWVVDGFSGRLSVIDPLLDSVTLVAGDMYGVSGLASGFGSLWLTDAVGDRVIRLNTRTRQVEETIDLAADSGPSAIAVGSDAIWVANQVAMTLSRIDPASNAVVTAAIPLCCRPTALAVLDSDVWVLSADSDRVQRVDSGRDAVALTVEVGDGPSAVIARDDGVWVTNALDQTLLRLDRAGNVLAVVELDGQPSALAFIEGALWVALRGD
jgi:class 3 adenylate cyclase/DNA-binding beta-propeller fold protein YncE